MSDWDTPVASAWVDEPTTQGISGWVDDTAGADAAGYSGIDPEHISKHDNGVDDNACHNCGQSGHYSRDCQEPRQNTGECYKCGQVGHNKAECTNEAVERAFTGICRTCGEEGHRSSACPQAVCKKCSGTGHTATECTEKFNVYPADLPKINDADQAWENLIAADASGDVDDFIQAFWVYCKLAPELTLVQLEECFRQTDFHYYLIAKEQIVPSKVHTNVDLQGNSGKKYQISFQRTSKPRRAILAEGWPKSPEENLERLQDAGFSMDNMQPFCSSCGNAGHSRKYCPEGEEVVEKPKVTCSNCNNEGHYVRDCPEPRAVRGGDIECKHCSEMGHMARDCPNKPAQLCRNCQEEGHRASECVNERVMICHNCNTKGHAARDCTEPVNLDNVQCRNCDKNGHFSKECPEPKNWAKVQCRNCNEHGHGAGRCPNPPAAQAEAATEDYTTGAGGSGEVAAEGDWMNSGAVGGDAAGADDWNTTPAVVSAW